MKAVHHSAPEVLESRIAPSTVYAITSNNHLIEFDSAAPGDISSDTALTGFGAGETVVGMDFRPATGQLYAVTIDGANTGRLYIINLQTAAATNGFTLTADPSDATNPYTTMNGTSFGVDFNPIPDRLRIVSNTGQSLRVNPNSGLVTTDGQLNPGTPNVVAAAYANSFSGATATTLFDIDSATDQLFTQSPPNDGTLVPVGAGLGVDVTNAAGFDIHPVQNKGYAALTVAGVLGLYTIDLGAGTATSVGAIGNGTTGLLGFAVAPVDLTFINSKTATFTDEDGDLVTVKVSKGTLNRGDFILRPTANGGLLSQLNLGDDAGDFDQANVSITSKAANGGDGFVRVGHILSSLNDLGSVIVDGDLARITAGDLTTTDAALKSLTVQSLGLGGTLVQLPGGSLQSNLTGPVGSITVKTDIVDAFVNVSGGTAGELGKLTVGGSLVGGGAANSGRVFASGIIGTVKIGRDIQGGAGDFSGGVESTVSLGTVTVGGSLIGSGADTGRIAGAEGIGAVKIAHDVTGVGVRSGVIAAPGGSIKSIAIGGSVFGGADGSTFFTASANIGSVLIKGDLTGSTGFDTGAILANKVGPVTVLGSVIGGSGEDSGSIRATADILSVKIGRELRGGGGESSGSIIAASLGPVTIGLSMIGGSGNESGSIDISGPVASVKVGGDVRGGGGQESAYIHSLGLLGPVSIKGSLVGGAGSLSAVIYAGNAVLTGNVMKGVSIGGDIVGGTGPGSASIGAVNGAIGNLANVDIGPVVVKGTVIGNATDTATITGNNITSILIGGSFRGGTGQDSANIRATGELKTLAIGGSVLGGGDQGAGFISTEKLGTANIGGDLRGGGATLTGYLNTNLGGAKSITIGGDVTNTGFALNGSISVNAVLGSLTIGGDVTGTFGVPATISARGEDGKMTPAIGKLTIKGSMIFGQILGGHLLGVVNNADANLGPITIGGDFIASSISAGVNTGGNGVTTAGTDGYYGTADDIASTVNHTAGNVSRILSVIIKGQALGNASAFGDAYGIVAKEIKVLKVGGATYPSLNATTQGPISLSPTGDFFARTDV